MLLEESSGDEKDASAVDDDNYSQSDSVKELKRVLKSVSKDEYQERHHNMITELRIRKMLARQKIKYPTKESFTKRKNELIELYRTFQGVSTER